MKRSMAARDRAWLESLFDAHAGALRAFAVRRVGVDDGDDIVAEVFVTAWRRRNEAVATPRTEPVSEEAESEPQPHRAKQPNLCQTT